MEIDKDGWQAHFDILPKTVEKIANVAVALGYLLFTHLTWETDGRNSDHRRPEIYSMTDEQVMQEWREQDI